MVTYTKKLVLQVVLYQQRRQSYCRLEETFRHFLSDGGKHNDNEGGRRESEAGGRGNLPLSICSDCHSLLEWRAHAGSRR